MTSPITITQTKGGSLTFNDTTLDLGGNGAATDPRILLEGDSSNPGELNIQYNGGGKTVKTGLSSASESALITGSITGITVDGPGANQARIGKSSSGKLAHLYAGSTSTNLKADSTDRIISSTTAVN
jgi:hypothetical protein